MNGLYLEDHAGVRRRCWKSLGPIWMGIDIAYAIDGWHGDLDLDREADLRIIATRFVARMQAEQQNFVEGAIAEIEDWPTRGRTTVLGFTSADPAISQHVYRQVAELRH